MDVTPLPMPMLLAVVAAITATGFLLLFGGWLVRRFNLPTDVPEGPAFEPPPPPLIHRPDRKLADTQAATTRAARSLAERARTAAVALAMRGAPPERVMALAEAARRGDEAKIQAAEAEVGKA